MFTHTIDTAIDRWTGTDGNEYAYSYDEISDSPFDWGWEGLCFIPDARDSMEAGDIGIPDSLKSWLLELEEYQFDAENLTEEDTEEVRAAVLKALADHEAARPEIEWFDYAGYRVYVDVPTFTEAWGAPYSDQAVRWCVDTYNTWAEGNVYEAGVTTPDGKTEYLAGIFLDWDEDLRTQIEEVMRDLV